MMNLRNRKLVRTIQILFGLYLIFFGVIGYIVTLPAPPYNEAGLAFLMALFATGYMIHAMSIIFVLSGLMFIFNKWSAFGAVLLAPITVNIVLFHVFLDMTAWWMALIFAIVNGYLVWVHWQRYNPMFSKK